MHLKILQGFTPFFENTDITAGYFDLTGHFPQRSSRGNQYVMIAYNYDANEIWGLPLPNREAKTIHDGFCTLHKRYTLAGAAPNTYILDNEKSSLLISTFQKKSLSYQLVPPHHHNNNLAERAIQTWKHHFKSGLATVDPDYPLSEWDRLIDQANITLNLMQGSCANPKLSAWAYLSGVFDYNKTS